MNNVHLLLISIASGLGALTVPLIVDVAHIMPVQGRVAYMFIFAVAALNFWSGYKVGRGNRT